VTKSARFSRTALPYFAVLAAATAFTLPATALPANALAMAKATPTRGAEWWLTALDAPKAWQTAPSQGAGVTVAVLSTGVDPGHADLDGDVTTGPDFSGSGRTPDSEFWGFEGTAVASLIAGHGHGPDGMQGITGVAPRAKILSLRVTIEYNDSLNTNSAITKRLPNAIAEGIRYAVNHGAQVIALPLDPGTLNPATGNPATGNPAADNPAATGNPAADNPAATGGSAAERAAVSYALARNVVLVAPAGDNGASTGSVNYPAAYPGVVAVGATERGGGLAPFTSARPYVAVTAPGTSLTVAAPAGDGYEKLSSSDMSSALAVGVAALIRSRFPRLTEADVARSLLRGATAARNPGEPGNGHGALNAASALNAAAALAATLPSPAQAGSTASGSHAPKSGQPARRAAQPARQGGSGALAGSVLRAVVIVAGALILALAIALARLQRQRRRAIDARRAAAAGPSAAGNGARNTPADNQGTTRRGGSHTRRAIASADSAASQRTGYGTAGSTSTDDNVLQGTAYNPRGTRRALSRARFAADSPGRPRVIPMALPGSARQSRRGQEQARPPWELPAKFTPSPMSSGFQDGSATNSGPMYVWNPAASSGPFPAVDPGSQPYPNGQHSPDSGALS